MLKTQNNLRDIITVAKFTMRDLVGRKSFRISTLITLILIVLGFNIPNIINGLTGGNLSSTMLIADPDNVFEGQLDQLTPDTPQTKLEISQESPDKIKELINQGEVESAIVIDKLNAEIQIRYLVEDTAMMSGLPQGIIDQLKMLYTNIQIHKLGLSDQQLAKITPKFELSVEATQAETVKGNPVVMMLLSMVLFFAIYFCAYQVSSSITVEKTSKIVETLVTSTSPRSIILGKTIGIGLVGLGQVLLFTTVALISAYSFLDPEVLNALLDTSALTPLLGGIMILYFVLGYFMYALLYALTGSTVSKPEDIQSANTPVAFITMFGFYLAYFTLTDPTSSLNTFAALFPISSPFCMPLRVMMGIASPWEVILSVVILLATCAIIARIAIKIYSNAILNYGTKMNLKEIVKSYKQD